MSRRTLTYLVRRGVEHPERILPFLRQTARGRLTDNIAPVVEGELLSEIKTSEELRDYALTGTDHSLWEYDTERRISFRQPRNPNDAPDRILEAVGEHRFPKPFVAEISDCCLVGPRPIATTAEGAFLLDSACGRGHMLSRGVAHSIVSGTNPFTNRGLRTRSIEEAALLSGPLARFYPHWFHDYLTRLAGIEHYMRETGNRPPVVVPGSVPYWMRESLSLLGYSAEDLITWKRGKTRVERLVIPSIRQEREALTRHVEQFTARVGYEYRHRIRENVGDRATELNDPASRIFITREDAPTRRVVNRSEINTVLREHGFKPYTLSDLGWPSQVQLFTSAEVVVGAHGAGLVNTIYGPDDLSMVELFGDHVTAGYFSLANVLGFDYSCLECDPEGEDLRVDPSGLDEVLSAVC